MKNLYILTNTPFRFDADVRGGGKGLKLFDLIIYYLELQHR